MRKAIRDRTPSRAGTVCVVKCDDLPCMECEPADHCSLPEGVPAINTIVTFSLSIIIRENLCNSPNVKHPLESMSLKSTAKKLKSIAGDA